MNKSFLFLVCLFFALLTQSRAKGHKHHKDWCLVEPECELVTKSCANDAFRECKHARDCADGAACMTVKRCNTNRAVCSVNSDCKAVRVECASDMDCPFTRCKGFGKCSHTSSSSSCFSDSDCSHGEICLRLNGTCVTSGKRCFRDIDCPTYPCDMSGKMFWADQDGEDALNKREIFLIVWCIGVCLVLCFFCICWCRGSGSSSRKGGGDRPGRRIISGGGGGGVQVHVTGQDDDDDSEQDEEWERRSSPMETTIYLGPGQSRRRTKGKMVRRSYSDV